MHGIPLGQVVLSANQLPLSPSELKDLAPSSATTRELVAKMPGIRYVLEPCPGLDVARNTNVRRSTSELIAFTDDDVTIHPNWIRGVRRGFHDPAVLAVTGLVLPAELETEAQLIFESYWGFNRGYRAKIFDTEFFKRTRDHGVPAWEISGLVQIWLTDLLL